MRKSIFLTVILALWSVLTFGQGTADTEATPTKPSDCTENENFPAAGVPHSYIVAIGEGQTEYDGAGTEAHYQWYVTQDATKLLSSGDAIGGTAGYFTVGSSAGESSYNAAAATGTTNKLTLTWTPKAIIEGGTTKPYFLVLNYKENHSENGCLTNNVKVMKIEPLNRFQLEMIAYDKENSSDFSNGDGTDCAADVSEATYADGKITYKYGQQTLYYKVTAKGFVGDWLPKFRLPNLQGKQTYASAKIYTDLAGTTDGPVLNTLNTTNAGTNAGQTLIGASTLAISDATNGTDYLLEVVINNNTYETTEAQDLATNNTTGVAVDGTYGTATGGNANEALKDQSGTCTEETEFFDFGKYTIKNRPKITATSGKFIQRVE